jgi:hypothetical protein
MPPFKEFWILLSRKLLFGKIPMNTLIATILLAKEKMFGGTV